jgi:Domain of Unknown Function (DUF1080)
MRRLCLVLVLLAVPAFADEKTKPNTLTAKEVADGWLMLFDGETAFGWKTDGDVAVKDGALVLKGGDKGAAISCPARFGAFELKMELPKGTGNGQLSFKTATSDSVLGLPAQPAEIHIRCKINKDGSTTETSIDPGPDGGVRMRILQDVEAPPEIRIASGPQQNVILKSIVLKPTAMQSLFSGKDLTGWKLHDAAKARALDPKTKEVPAKSQYTVTKDGWLNVKNGPGDLQTEGQWADFVAQLECISNGKHLNSGLFFRAIPDLYQQGYEAQIRNEWMGDDRTKPVDFGTGAIYRRQPARRVVSTDGEWFTMTVAAHGRHIATWVNGYQVVDWTDDRKESDNARQGFKKGKGALSIQGHDATTDLSFRNIRVQSLDPK